jgi:lysophospholipase L1-like esterase
LLLPMGPALLIGAWAFASPPPEPIESVEVPELPERPPLATLLHELEGAEGALGHDIAIEDPSGRALAPFYAALHRAELGKGQARVLFYGGSHTAGDFLTGRMREILQTRYGDSGHGFVPLVPVVDRAWAWAVRIDEAEGFGAEQVGFKAREVHRYGLAGVAFVADEPEAFAAVESDSWGNGREASRLTLLYDRRPGAGHLEVWVDGQRVETLDTASDPAEAGRWEREVSDTTHRLEVRAVGDAPVTVFGAVMERDAPGVIVENLGLVGSKARHHLLWDEALWREQFVQRDADLVALAYGNNETTDTHLTVAQHEAHLREVMARIRAATPDAACLLVGPTDRPREGADGALEARPLVAELTEMQRRVAADHGCAFFDTLAFQGGLGAGIEWLRHDPPWMRDDRQHLTRDGYVRWSEALTRALLEGYEP